MLINRAVSGKRDVMCLTTRVLKPERNVCIALPKKNLYILKNKDLWKLSPATSCRDGVVRLAHCQWVFMEDHLNTEDHFSQNFN